MNFGSVPKIPAVPSIPAAPAVPTRVGQDLSQGPASGNVGIGAPQHFDPNNPSVRLDGTVHNPTGVGGDLKVSREVSVNDLKQIPVPDVHAPDLSMPSLGGDSSTDGSSGGSGFSLPSIGNPLSGLSMPSLPDMPSMPSMPDVSLPSMPSLPDMPSLGNPFSGISAPDLSLPSMPDFGNPFSGLSGPDFSLPDLPSMGTPGMPGFRFLELPDLPDIELDLSEWDLLPSFDIPDWDGDNESERQKPDVRAKKTDKVKVEIRLETEEGFPFSGAPIQVRGEDGFRFQGNLDQEGILIVEVPRGDLDVGVVDTPQSEMKLLAIRLFKAMKTKTLESIPPLLVAARGDFRALERSIQDLDRSATDSVPSRIRSLFASAGREAEIAPLLALQEAVLRGDTRQAPFQLRAAQTAPFHEGILGFFLEATGTTFADAEWGLYPIPEDRSSSPAMTRHLSPLGKSPSICFPANPGRWLLAAHVPGSGAVAQEFQVHGEGAALAPDLPLGQLDPEAFVGVVRKCQEWLLSMDSEENIAKDAAWSRVANMASRIHEATTTLTGTRFPIHGGETDRARACLANTGSGWTLLDWSDAALDSGRILWTPDTSVSQDGPQGLLQHWLDKSPTAADHAVVAIPEDPTKQDLSSGSMKILMARSTSPKTPSANAGSLSLWYRMVSRACRKSLPLRPFDLGLRPSGLDKFPNGFWKEGSHRVDLAMTIAGQHEGILGKLSSREWEPGTKVDVAGSPLASWSREQGDWTEHVLFESLAMEGFRQLLDNSRMAASERLSLLLGEIGNLVEQGKLRFHVRHTDSTDPRENWSARGPVSCSSLDVVGFTAKSRSCKLVANTWKSGVVEERSAAGLPDSDLDTGIVQAHFLNLAGVAIPMERIELLSEGIVEWQGSAPDGKVRIDNIPLKGYILRTSSKGKTIEFLVAWEPSNTTNPAQICRIPFSLEA
ncbi:MAG: hypothetical protein IPK50_07670 [Fibrobacterota bacterium]|nr:MAG: hypothetical protein IPK50_07670 [Fibrobacterota bacterium]